MSKEFKVGEVWNADNGKKYYVDETFRDKSLTVVEESKKDNKYRETLPLNAEGQYRNWDDSAHNKFTLTTRVGAITVDGIYVSDSGRKFRIVRTDFYNNGPFGDRYPIVAFDVEDGELWLFDEKGYCPEEGQLRVPKQTYYVSVWKDKKLGTWESVVSINPSSDSADFSFSFED